MSLSRTRLFIRRAFAVWTGVLIILVVSASRAIPPVVLAFLLPYLTLVACYMLARQGTAETDRSPIPVDSAASPLADLELEFATSAPSAILEVGSDSPEVSETNPASVTEQRPSTTAPVRTRRRVKLKPVPEPSLASWVQVGPGRFVRGEEPQPTSASSVEVEPMSHAPDSPHDLDDGLHDNRPAEDAARERLVVGNPAGLTVVPLMASAAGQPGDAPVHLQDGVDHVSTNEAVLADSAWMPGSSGTSESRPVVANATPGSHGVD